jgi:hypothetical protein
MKVTKKSQTSRNLGFLVLKVDGNEKEVGQKNGIGWVLVWDCGDRWLFAI